MRASGQLYNCFIRAAALKTLFPSDAGDDGSSKQSPMDGDAGKKLMTATHYRSCPECSQPNPKSAKKCQKCQKPLQGKACPQCGRPNHSWVPSCYKCGTSLPSYLGKTGKGNTGEVWIKFNAKQKHLGCKKCEANQKQQLSDYKSIHSYTCD